MIALAGLLMAFGALGVTIWLLGSAFLLWETLTDPERETVDFVIALVWPVATLVLIIVGLAEIALERWRGER